MKPRKLCWAENVIISGMKKDILPQWVKMTHCGQTEQAPRAQKKLVRESDMFDAAFAYLNSIEVKPHITAWLGLNTANYIEEGYPNADAWNALLDGAAVALGKTREEIDAFLADIPTE